MGSQRRTPAALPPGKNPGAQLCISAKYFDNNSNNNKNNNSPYGLFRLLLHLLTTLFPARFEVLTAVFVSFLVFGMWRCQKYSPNNAASHTGGLNSQPCFVLRACLKILARTYSGVRYSLHTVTFNKFCVGSFRVAGFILQTLMFQTVVFVCAFRAARTEATRAPLQSATLLRVLF